MFVLFLKTYWKQVLGALLVLGVVLYVQALRIEVANKTAALAKSEANYAQLNASIDALSKGTDAIKKNFDALGLSVKANQAQLDKKLADVLKEKKPQTCADAIKYLREAQYK